MTVIYDTAGTLAPVYDTAGTLVWGGGEKGPAWRNIAIGPLATTGGPFPGQGPYTASVDLTLTSDASEIRLGWTAVHSATRPAGPVTYVASVDGVPVTFEGEVVGVCAPGTVLSSDILAGSWAAGQVVQVTTTVDGDSVPSTAPRPYLVSALTTDPSVLVIGSSSAVPDTFLDGFRAAGVAVVNGSIGGSRQISFPDALLREDWNVRGAGFTHAFLQVGLNTMDRGTAELIQTSIDLAWRVRNAGIPHVTQKIWKPYTTSTDGWTTVEGQEPRYPSRAEAASWMRRGAPVTPDGLTPDLHGQTPGALYVGERGHPFSQIADLGALLQADSDPDAWRVDHGPITGDGLHMDGTGYALMAPGVERWARGL